MRDAAGQLLGAMCGRLGTAVYEEVRAPVLELIRSNLERSEEVSMTDDGGGGGRTAEGIFHDTAGWRNLETSIKCLQGRSAHQAIIHHSRHIIETEVMMTDDDSDE